MKGNFRRRELLETAGREVPCAGTGARRGFGTERVGGDVPTDRRPGASGVIIGARPMVRSLFFPYNLDRSATVYRTYGTTALSILSEYHIHL